MFWSEQTAPIVQPISLKDWFPGVSRSKAWSSNQSITLRWIQDSANYSSQMHKGLPMNHPSTKDLVQNPLTKIPIQLSAPKLQGSVCQTNCSFPMTNRFNQESEAFYANPLFGRTCELINIEGVYQFSFNCAKSSQHVFARAGFGN